MTVEPMKTKSQRLQNGIAAGMLVLTMSVVGAVTEADSQPPTGLQEAKAAIVPSVTLRARRRPTARA